MNPIDNYILGLSEPFKAISLALIDLVQKSPYEFELKYKWKIPFFYYKGKPFCFVNASVKKKYVDLAFYKGFQLKKSAHILNGEGRTQVKSLRITSLDDPLFDFVWQVIEEAVSLNDGLTNSN